jgi:nicotinate-nucleotide adenylyltransferase
MERIEKTQTIIYGGAFNPPTLAHEAIIIEAVEFARQHEAEVWILPSGDRTDKLIPVSRERRLGYIAAMLSDVPHEDITIRVDETELAMSQDTETYDTATYFKEQYPDRSFRWIFGADSTRTMASWKQGQWILEHLDMLVVERPGSVINPKARDVETMNIPPLTVSSTEVRRRLETGEPIDDLVGPAVRRLLLNLQTETVSI